LKNLSAVCCFLLISYYVFFLLEDSAETGATIEGEYKHHSDDLDRKDTNLVICNEVFPIEYVEIVDNDIDIPGI
jgi:hypothetical protein